MDLPVIEHFKHCPQCAATTIERIRDVGLRCASCDFTLFFNPTSAAATLIEDDQGRLLAIERAKEPAKGKFGLPGGFLDLNETAEAAALREAKEEVNLQIESIEHLGTWPNQYIYKNVIYPVLDSYFIGHVHSFDSLAAEADEVRRIHFVDPRQVPSEQWAFPSLRQAIAKYLEIRYG